MNDDFYINAPVTISDFVDIKSLRVKPKFKRTRIGAKESAAVRKMAYTAANINNQKLLKKLGYVGRKREHYLAHVGYIQDKFVWEAIMKIPEVAKRQKETSKRRFRNNKDLWFPGLTTLYDHEQEGSHESSLKACYIDTSHRRDMRNSIKKCILDGRTRGEFQMLCINDVRDSDQQQSYKLIEETVLEAWPQRSIAEKYNYKSTNPDVRCICGDMANAWAV